VGRLGAWVHNSGLPCEEISERLIRSMDDEGLDFFQAFHCQLDRFCDPDTLGMQGLDIEDLGQHFRNGGVALAY